MTPEADSFCDDEHKRHCVERFVDRSGQQRHDGRRYNRNICRVGLSFSLMRKATRWHQLQSADSLASGDTLTVDQGVARVAVTNGMTITSGPDRHLDLHSCGKMQNGPLAAHSTSK